MKTRWERRGVSDVQAVRDAVPAGVRPSFLREGGWRICRGECGAVLAHRVRQVVLCCTIQG